MIPKDLKSVQTTLNPSEFHSVIGALNERPNEIAFQPSIEAFGSVITQFLYAGRNYQMIQEHGLLVSVMGR